MKQKLLLLFISCLFSTVAIAQLGTFTDDFQTDTSTMNWFESGSSPNPPTYAVDDGPSGVGDHYMTNVASGTGGPGGRMVVRNVTQWTGDYTLAGVLSIKFDARAISSDLDFRVAMNGAGGTISSTNFVTVTAGSGWQQVIISVVAADMVEVTSNAGSGFDKVATLADVNELRILSSPTPAYAGEIISATMDLDNISAGTTLGIDQFSIVNDFKISPNPSTSELNIQLSEVNDDLKVEVFDILGKRILIKDISQVNTRINVSGWESGVYLVKVSNDGSTQTKRFIKQ